MATDRLPLRAATRLRLGDGVGRVAGLVVAGGGVAVAGVFGGAPFVLGATLLLMAVIAVVNRPQRGILIVAALAPYDGLLLVVPHAQIVKSWKEMLVLATLVATMVCPEEARGAPGRRRPGWLAGVVALVLVGLGSAVTVGFTQAQTGFRIDFFYLLLALCVWRAPLSPREQDRLVTILMANGAITAVVGIAQQGLGAARLHALGYAYNDTIRTAGGHLRSFSTFNQPFPFAFFMMLVLLVCLPPALAEPRRLRNQLFLASVPILGVGMLTSVVRAAWLGAAAGWVYLGLRRHRVLLLAVPLAVVALLYVPGSLTTTALSGTSLGERSSTWSENISHVLTHPFGSGIGSAGAAAQKTASLTGETTGIYEPDNYYFKTLYELGVLGLWFLVLVFVASFRETELRSQMSTGPPSAFCLGVSASVLAAAVASLIATYFEIFPMDLMFWLLVTVVATTEPVPLRADTASPNTSSNRTVLPRTS